MMYFLLYVIYLLLLLFMFSIWDGVGTKDRFFQRGWGMGMEALERILGFFWRELAIIISADQSNWEAF